MKENVTSSNMRSPTNYEDSKSTFSRQISAGNAQASAKSASGALNIREESGDAQFDAQLRKHQLDAYAQNIYYHGSLSPSLQHNQKIVLISGDERQKKSRGRNQTTAKQTSGQGVTAAQIRQEEYELHQLQVQMAHAHQYSKKHNKESKNGVPTGKEKSKNKKSKGAQKMMLQESLLHSLETSGYHGKSAKNKSGQRVSIQNALVAAAQAQHASQLVASHNSPSKRRSKQLSVSNPNPTDFASEYALQQKYHATGGQGGGGTHGRRKLVDPAGTPIQNITSAKAANDQNTSQRGQNQRDIIMITQDSQTPGGDINMQSKRTSANVALHSNSNSLKRNQAGNSTGQHSQAYSYANQIKETAERASHQQVQQVQYSSKGKHGLRKNQPVPIDTFNIVSNRRKSLVKQVNEANANSDVVNLSYGGGGTSQTFAEGLNVTRGNVNSNPGSANNNPGLILPEIPSNSKSGLQQYHRSPGGPPGANLTQKSGDIQSAMGTQMYQPPSQANSNTNYHSINQSMDNTGAPLSSMAAGGSKDIKRRTTGSIFQSPNGNQMVSSLIHNQTFTQQQKQHHALSTHNANNISKRIKNIISPIQASAQNSGQLDLLTGKQNAIQASGAESSRLLRKSINKSSEDQLIGTVNQNAQTQMNSEIGKSAPVNFTQPSRLEKVSVHSGRKVREGSPNVVTDMNQRPVNMVSTPDYEMVHNQTYSNDASSRVVPNTRKNQTVVDQHTGGLDNQIAPSSDEVYGQMNGRGKKPRLVNHVLNSQQPFESQLVVEMPRDSSQVSQTQSSGDADGDEDEDGSSDENDDIEEAADGTDGLQSMKSLQPQPQDITDRHGTDITNSSPGKSLNNGPNGETRGPSNFTQQLNSGKHQIRRDGAGTTKAEKKKTKKSKRQNTHHHYHIDFNFEQVNNILVSYGGMGLHQQIKQQIKKDTSKANVSLSMGIVNGQLNQSHGRGHSIQIPNVQGGQSGPNVVPQSPTKRTQMQQNGLLLPELIINKNKINFGSKSFKLNLDEQKLSSRQQKDIYQGHNTNSFNLGIQNGGGKGGKSKRRRHKKDHQSNVNFMEDPSSNFSTAQKKSYDKYKTPKRHHISQSLNPSATGQPIQQMPATEGRYYNNNAVDQDQIRILKQNQVNLHKQQIDLGDVDDGPTNPSRTSKRSNKISSKLNSSRVSAKGERQNTQLDGTQSKEVSQQNWNSPRKPTESGGNYKNSQPNTNSKVVFATNASNYPPTSKTPAGTLSATGAPSNSLKVRQKHQLSVITKGGGISSGGVLETPKRFFNVKAQQSGQKVKMAVAEHQSTGIRNTQRRSREGEESTPVVGKGNFNTLNQIQSTVGQGDKDAQKVKPLHNTSLPVSSQGQNSAQNNPISAHPFRGAGSVPPRNHKVKNIIKEQEKKLKLIDDQNKRTHQMIEQFNNSNRPLLDQETASAVDLTSSPLIRENKFLGQKNLRVPKPKISDFEMQEIVGIGNFGKVHKAYNKRAKRICALKILKKESVAQMKHVDHIINEREVLQYLQELNKQFLEENPPHDGDPGDPESLVPECPFMMGIYSSFQDKENLYFELEYIQGCTLLSQIRQYNQTVMQSMPYYAAEVLLTLEYLHSHNVIYRDLKPENIVISMTERGHVKMVDFGFAKRLKSINQRTDTNCGTPAYIAPEILRGHNGHGYEVDIWSLGVLMVELVSGQTPFQAETTQGVYEKVSLCQPQYNKFVNQQLRELLSKIFVSDPELRIKIDQIKLHPVFREFDWEVPMRQRFFNSMAPYIPSEAQFNEVANRDSEQMKEQNVKPKNILAAIMGNPMGDPAMNKEAHQKNMDFDEAFYNKFERQDKMARNSDLNDNTAGRRRQNPLGDFKFRKINELF